MTIDLPAANDAEIYLQLLAANRSLAQDLLADPATLACGLDHTYRPRPHLRLIAQALAGLEAGDYDRLLITTPPQVGKTSLVSEWGSFWWLAKHPSDKVVIGSYGDSLAHKRGRKIRELVEDHGAEFGLFVKPGSSSVQDWETTQGGGVRSVGVGAGLTGHSSNCVILDDPHKDRAEAESGRIRGAVHDWYSSTVLTRLQPDRNAVVVVQTRWVDDDLAGRRLSEEGRLEDGGRWKVVHLPAIADSKFGVDPLGRAPGEPLTHPKIPVSDVDAQVRWWRDKQATTAPRDWHALYQGDPQPVEGTLLAPGLLKERTHNPPPAGPVKTGVAVDPSGGGRDTAGIIGGFLGDDGKLYATHDRTVTGPSESWGRSVCALAVEIDADVVVVESNFGGDMAKTIIRLAWSALSREHPDDVRYKRLPPQVKTVRAKKGKLLRAEPIAQQISDDRYRLGGHLPDLVHEWETWQSTSSESPGRIDASVYLAYELLPVPGAEAVVSVPTGVRRVGVGGSRGGARIRRSGR